MALEPGVDVVFFLLVTAAAQGLQVADVVSAPTGQGDNVIYSQFCFLMGFATALALVRVPREYIFPHLWGNWNPGSFLYFFHINFPFAAFGASHLGVILA